MRVEIKIPEERVGALVGDRRRALTRLEKATHTKITAKENVVTITGEALNVWKARDVVRAVGRGFSPVRALRLMEEDAALEVIELGGLSDSRLKSVRARIIGRGGRARELIEELTDTCVSVYGKTVSVIGDEEGTAAAREAVEMLVRGSRHGTVYARLERWNRDRS